eukprot:scaffold74117_cov61-Phaeocystis_antarctica.AAC.2
MQAEDTAACRRDRRAASSSSSSASPTSSSLANCSSSCASAAQPTARATELRCRPNLGREARLGVASTPPRLQLAQPRHRRGGARVNLLEPPPPPRLRVLGARVLRHLAEDEVGAPLLGREGEGLALQQPHQPARRRLPRSGG